MLETWQEKVMLGLSPEFITHHPDFLHLPHPSRDPRQDTCEVWTYVTCVVCHHGWARANPEPLKWSFLRGFFRR